MDFTLKTYRSLLESLTALPHRFQPFAEFLEQPAGKAIILRHDVEARYDHALAFAKIQHEFNIRGTYYFRFLPGHYDESIIASIASLGHEIGYHYDDLSACHGDFEAAIRRFERNLATLREIAPVKTICMEGAPLSKWDNREMWSAGSRQLAVGNGQSAVSRQQSAVNDQNQKPETRNPKPETRNYRIYGIIGEPYFDIDFSKVFYLTDTGRRWDGKISVRDRVGSWQSAVGSPEKEPETRNQKPETKNPKFRHTREIIAAANAGTLPDQIMMTFHPQRWTDSYGPWLQELLMQNVKNVVKRWIVRK